MHDKNGENQLEGQEKKYGE